MKDEVFYRNNRMSMRLEHALPSCESLDEFEKNYTDEFLNEDTRIGDYLDDLLWKYDKKASAISENVNQGTVL